MVQTTGSFSGNDRRFDPAAGHRPALRHLGNMPLKLPLFFPEWPLRTAPLGTASCATDERDEIQLVGCEDMGYPAIPQDVSF
jgi:hypothetical protein